MSSGNDLRFVQITDGFPEQYDVYAGETDDTIVGYVRIRWGTVSATCPNVGGVEVFRDEEIMGFGCFEDEEREYYLACIRQAIQQWRESNG